MSIAGSSGVAALRSGGFGCGMAEFGCGRPFSPFFSLVPYLASGTENRALAGLSINGPYNYPREIKVNVAGGSVLTVSGILQKQNSWKHKQSTLAALTFITRDMCSPLEDKVSETPFV